MNLLHPTIPGWARAAHESVAGAPPFSCQAGAAELSSKADCRRHVHCTPKHAFRMPAVPPPPMKSDHPTQLLFLSLAHLRNFNTAEYS